MTQRKDGPRRRRLGRGLSSLMTEPVEVPVDGGAPPATPPAAGDLLEIPLSSIRPNPNQPRRHFDETALEELASSIRVAGLMQPVVVRPADEGYELIAGERRWRAAQRLELERIPALVRAVDDPTAAQWALIENVQREDLNAIERAEAFQRLTSRHGWTQQDIADQVGLQRSTIANHLRLLELSDDIQETVRRGQLSMGHARALLAITNLDDRARLAREAVKSGWSVREIERRCRAAGRGPGRRPPTARTANQKDLEERLGAHLGTKVAIRQGRKAGTGTIAIEFFDLDQFQGLLDRMGFRSG